jgi:hypothetical protein
VSLFLRQSKWQNFYAIGMTAPVALFWAIIRWIVPAAIFADIACIAVFEFSQQGHSRVGSMALAVSPSLPTEPPNLARRLAGKAGPLDLGRLMPAGT